MYKLLNGKQIYEVDEVDTFINNIKTVANTALAEAEEVNSLAQEAKNIAEASKQELTEGIATVNEKFDASKASTDAALAAVHDLRDTVAISLANSSKALEKAEKALKQQSHGNIVGGVLGNNWQVLNPVYAYTDPHYLCDCTTNIEGFNLLAYLVTVPSETEPEILETRIDIYKTDQEYKHVTKCTLPSGLSITDYTPEGWSYPLPSIAKLNDTYVMSLFNTVVYTTTGDTWQVCNGLPMNQDVVYITRSAACDDTYIYIMQVDAATCKPLAVYKSSDGINFVLHKQLEVVLPEGYEGTVEFYATMSVSNTNGTIFYAIDIIESLNINCTLSTILYTLNNDRTTPILSKILLTNTDCSSIVFSTLISDASQVTFTHGIYIYNTSWSAYSFNTEFTDIIEVIPPSGSYDSRVQGPFIIDDVPIIFNFYAISKFNTAHYINAQWSLAGGYTFKDTELAFLSICNVVDGKIVTYAYNDTNNSMYLFETTDGMQFSIYDVLTTADTPVPIIVGKVGNFYVSPNTDHFGIATSLIELSQSPNKLVLCYRQDIADHYYPVLGDVRVKRTPVVISDTIAIYKSVQEVYISRG